MTIRKRAKKTLFPRFARKPSFSREESEELSPESYFSYIYDTIQREVGAVDIKDSKDVGVERVLNLFNVPMQLERFMLVGYLVCLDSFLFIFTILPIRVLWACVGLLRWAIQRESLHTFHRNDLLKGFLIVASSYLLRNIDTSRLYHIIRGQTIIRLYMIFGVLEVLEKLCSAFGHDIMDSIFERKNITNRSLRRMNRAFCLVIGVVYVTFHTSVLMYQATCLNVAVNSYNNALLTLLMSNQFAEIKGTVFKKFESGNLFQLACSDVVERFHLSIFLIIVASRNFLEILGVDALGDFWGLLNSFRKRMLSLDVRTVFVLQNPVAALMNLFSTNEYSLVAIIFGPAIIVMITEIMVDWIKHSFIGKFNGLKPKIYRQFRHSLYRDLLGLKSHDMKLIRTGNDASRTPVVSRRMGFVSLPLACLVIHTMIHTLMNIELLPSTLVNENIEDMNQQQDELGSWKLPLELNKWLIASRKQGTRPTEIFAFLKSLWGVILVYVMFRILN